MALWLTEELYLANKPSVLRLYRHILKELDRGAGGLGLAAREARKRDVRIMFEVAEQEDSIDNIQDLANVGTNVLQQLRKGHLPEVNNLLA